MRHTQTLIIALVTTAPNAQQPPPDYGFDFATITDVNNTAYELNTIDSSPWYDGRGSVGYEYRIARTEIRAWVTKQARTPV